MVNLLTGTTFIDLQDVKDSISDSLGTLTDAEITTYITKAETLVLNHLGKINSNLNCLTLEEIVESSECSDKSLLQIQKAILQTIVFLIDAEASEIDFGVGYDENGRRLVEEENSCGDRKKFEYAKVVTCKSPCDTLPDEAFGFLKCFARTHIVESLCYDMCETSSCDSNCDCDD